MASPRVAAETRRRAGGRDRLGLPDKVIGTVQAELAEAAPAWRRRIGDSFLPPEHRELYLALLGERMAVLDLNG